MLHGKTIDMFRHYNTRYYSKDISHPSFNVSKTVSIKSYVDSTGYSRKIRRNFKVAQKEKEKIIGPF